MTEMTMKEALKLAIEALRRAEYNADYQDRRIVADMYGKAAKMLRDGGPVVEKHHTGCRCNWCSRYFIDGYDFANHNCGRTASMVNQKVQTVKKWTEREKIEIVVEKSELSYEEIKE